MKLLIAIDNGKAFLKTSDFPILLLELLLIFGPAILYLVGARKEQTGRRTDKKLRIDDKRWENIFL